MKNTRLASPRRRLVAGGAVAAVAAATMGVGMAAPAHADIDRKGTYGTGHYEFSVDRENRGFELSFDLEGVQPGKKYVVALRHDGKLVTRKTLTAKRDDGTGEISLERWVRNTAGKDTFKLRFREAGTKNYASATIVTR